MKKCDKLWLASDFDREGESIGWHIQNVLKVPSEKTKRIIFKSFKVEWNFNTLKPSRN